ncbi:hypothetical protein L873DRAFT_1803785 [Choiromyces venosus 120613-1]|uniref:Uncharacterized protein n=1 Tax=Choiromyces venosus 120613-1 TaxID=1336337 RepID=A0A3N4K5U0_9PEZI|nr:hypothetical protein L873DRAFT_1803785 [Choiromyces venosus 120613-1]
MKTTGFGTTVSDHTFKIPVAGPELAGLYNNVFVGAGRFVVNASYINPGSDKLVIGLIIRITQ